MIAARAFVGMFLVFAVSQKLLGGERIYPIAEEAVVTTVTGIFLNGMLAHGTPDPDCRARQEPRPPSPSQHRGQPAK
jgi:hypothetical protein